MENRPRMPMDDQEIPEVENKGGMKMPGGMALYAIMIVIALIASYGINYFVGVPKSGLDQQLATMNASIDAMKSDLRASKDSITTALNGLPASVESKVNSSISSINSKITSIESSVKTATDQANSAMSQANQVLNKLTTLENTIDELGTADTTALKTSIDSLTVTLNNLKTQYDTLKAQYDTLKAKVDTLSPSTTTPATGLSAILVGANPMPLIAGTNTINFNLVNNTAKALYQEQLSIQIQFLSPPTAISTWGLSLTSDNATFGTPSYSIVSGMVTYLVTGNLYIESGKSQPLSIILTAGTPPPTTVNYVVTVTATGYSSLP